MLKNKSYFFCGVGGSGMLPLAMIVKAGGAAVAGSDRALDQGRTSEKFNWLRDRGILLFPQDGSGITQAEQQLVASAAVEDTVADVAQAKKLGCRRVTRAQLLAEIFNGMAHNIAVGGTSGKSTVTGMIGWILHWAGLDPTIMNGAVMKNFVDVDTPFASSRIGHSGLMVSEVDESDGSIAMFDPEVAILNNISLDHKTLDELRQLFGDFAEKAAVTIWNIDDLETRQLVENLDIQKSVSFGFSAHSDFCAKDIVERPLGTSFTLLAEGRSITVELMVPGRHNIANALAAIAGARSVGVDLDDCVAAISEFRGLARRFDIVGTVNDITIIDDFGHNPDKIGATLQTVKAFPGRLIVFFQPHGFGPIRKMGHELATVFASMLGDGDELVICDPAYFGGTVDRSVGSDTIADEVRAQGNNSHHFPSREECRDYILHVARPGDRIIIMGARDDSLSELATGLLESLGNRDFAPGTA